MKNSGKVSTRAADPGTLSVYLADTLRDGILRISHAATGIDDRLDAELAKLRQAVRENATPASLDRLVEKVSRAVAAMDSKVRDQTVLVQRHGKSMLEALGTLPLDRALDRRWRDLRSQLAAPTVNVDEFLKVYSLLLRQAIEAQGGRKAKKGGGLFGLKGAKEDGLPPEALDRIREALTAMVSRVGESSELSEVASGLQRRVKLHLSPESLPELLESLSDIAEQSTQLEKKRFKEFSGRLAQELDRIRGTVEKMGETGLASAADTEELHARLSRSAQVIQHEIRNADDLETLQQMVSQEVDSLVAGIDTVRRVGAEQANKFKASIGLLQNRLGDVQAECNELYREIDDLRQENQLDPLTGLLNRSGFTARAQGELERAQRYGGALSVAIADIDHFKLINDRYGHQAGDTVIIAVGNLISTNTRKSDSVGRYGGEEFMVLLPNTDIAQATTVAEKIRRAIGQCSFTFRGKKVNVTVSLGVAELEEGETIASLVEKADKALYQAKAEGRNRTQCAVAR